MPAYSFKKQFVPLVESGTKRHTIRGKRKSRPRVGNPCFLYYAMRTKQCRFLLQAPCTKVGDVLIPKEFVILIDDQSLSDDECNSFAWADGFRPELELVPVLQKLQPFELMMSFWREDCDRKFPWHGDLIHWDYDRRVTDRKAVKRA